MEKLIMITVTAMMVLLMGHTMKTLSGTHQNVSLVVSQLVK